MVKDSSEAPLQPSARGPRTLPTTVCASAPPSTLNSPPSRSNIRSIVGGNATIASFEEAFCSGQNAPMGVTILGDSAAAHFHIPQQYVNARSFNLGGLVELLSNEADWPQCSWSTGYRNTSECPTSAVPMGSIYQRMRQNNLCMHRDFQNIGVNGARVGSMNQTIMGR